MPSISIVLSCFNGGSFLVEALNSFIAQSFIDWEIIFVNDGSTDESLTIAENFQAKDKRIRVYSKQNEGLNRTRNFGFKLISPDSKAVIFSDVDDILHPDMLNELYSALMTNALTGAVYCNYSLINQAGDFIPRHNTNNRYVPTRFWSRILKENEVETPFVSIYSWTPMIEPMTLIRRTIYDSNEKWDEINFPKGDTYGESIPVFGGIALNSKVIYVNRVLYYYRKHDAQITNTAFDIKKVEKKIDAIWDLKIKLKSQYKNTVISARNFRKYRLPLFEYINGSLKHELRYRPFKAGKNIIVYFLRYLYSLTTTVNP